MAVRLPTRSTDWRLMARTARLVVTIPGYAVVGVVAALFGLTLFVASLSLDLVGFALTGPLETSQRLEIVFNLYPFVGSEFDTLASVLLVGVALLFGVNVAMLVYHLREHDLSVREGSGSAAGLVLGTLGAGCAACGSAIFAGLFSILSATGLVAVGPVSLTFLPFDGLEFTALALVALVLSIYWLADGMRGGMVNGCPIDL